MRGNWTLKSDHYFLACPVPIHLGNGLHETKRLGHLDRQSQAGKGVVTTGSGILSQSQYSGTGDEGGKGANPYELIAAALAACFSMTLANELVSEGFAPDSISTTATVTMEPLSGGWTITAIELDVLAEVPGAKQGDFIRAAVSAKTSCTISRLLTTNISMSAKLEENRGTARVRSMADSLKVSNTK